MSKRSSVFVIKKGGENNQDVCGAYHSPSMAYDDGRGEGEKYGEGEEDGDGARRMGTARGNMQTGTMIH